MKPTAVALILLSLGVFMGFVVWTTVRSVEVECEVCLEFDGEEVCRFGRGASQAEALAAAQQSVCGGNVSGMQEAIACLSRIPDSWSCSTP